MLTRRTCHSTIAVLGSCCGVSSRGGGGDGHRPPQSRGGRASLPRGRGGSSRYNSGGDDESNEADLFSYSSASSPPPQTSKSSILKINSWLSKDRKDDDDNGDSHRSSRRRRQPPTSDDVVEEDIQPHIHTKNDSHSGTSSPNSTNGGGVLSSSSSSPFHTQEITWSTLSEFQRKEVFGPTALPYEMAFRLFVNSSGNATSGSHSRGGGGGTSSSSLSSNSGVGSVRAGADMWLQGLHAFLSARSQLISICPPRPSDYLIATKHCTSLPAICSMYDLIERDYGTDGGTIPPPTMKILQTEVDAAMKKITSRSRSSPLPSSSSSSPSHQQQLMLERLITRERKSQALLLDALRCTHLGKLVAYFPQLESIWNPYLRASGREEFPSRGASLVDLMTARKESIKFDNIHNSANNIKNVDDEEDPSKNNTNTISNTTNASARVGGSEASSSRPYYANRTDNSSPEYRALLSTLMDGAAEGYKLRAQGQWEDALPFYRNLLDSCQENLSTVTNFKERRIIQQHIRSQNSLLFKSTMKSANWEVALELVTPTMGQKVRTVGTIAHRSWIAALHLMAANRSRAIHSTTRLSPPSSLKTLFRVLSGRIPHAWRVALHSVQDAMLASPTLTTWSSPTNLTVTDRALSSSSRSRGGDSGGVSGAGKSLSPFDKSFQRYGSLTFEQHSLLYLLLASILNADLNRRHLGSQTSFETGLVLAKAKRISEEHWGEAIYPIASYALYRNTFNGYMLMMPYFVTPFNLQLEKRPMGHLARLCVAGKKGICVVDANMLERVILNIAAISTQLIQQSGGAVSGIQFIVPFPVILEFTSLLRRNVTKSNLSSDEGRSTQLSYLGIVNALQRATRLNSVGNRDDLSAPITVFSLEKELPAMVFNAISDLHGASSMWVIDKHVASVALSCQMGQLSAKDSNMSVTTFNHFHIREALGRHTEDTYRGHVWIATKDSELRAHAARCGLGVYPLGITSDGGSEEEDVDSVDDITDDTTAAVPPAATTTATVDDLDDVGSNDSQEVVAEENDDDATVEDADEEDV